MFEYSHFDYEILLAISPGRCAGLFVTRSRMDAIEGRGPGALETMPVPLWQRGRENAPASKLRRTLGIAPLRLLTMRLGEKGPDIGFIRRDPNDEMDIAPARSITRSNRDRSLLAYRLN